MIIHQDKFKRNDLVTWRDYGDIAAPALDRVRARIGVRFMTIRSVEELPRAAQDNVGHSQWVTVYEDDNTNTWSGKFFRHVTAVERAEALELQKRQERALMAREYAHAGERFE